MAKRDTLVVPVPVVQSHAERFEPLADLFLGIGVVPCHPKVAAPVPLKLTPSLRRRTTAPVSTRAMASRQRRLPRVFPLRRPGRAPSGRPTAKIISVPGGPFKSLALPACRIEDVAIILLGWVARDGLQFPCRR